MKHALMGNWHEGRQPLFSQGPWVAEQTQHHLLQFFLIDAVDEIAEPVANVVKTVKVIITPTNVRYKPDTVSFTRTKARTSKTLCTTCQ